MRQTGRSGAGLVGMCLLVRFAVSACGGPNGDRTARGRIVIGVRFDQPGLALEEPDGRFTGFDIDVATYTITSRRKQTVDFAGPYFLAHQDLLMRAGDTSITSAQNVKRRLAPKADLQEFRTITECLGGLENKAVDAMTNDDANLAGFTAQPQHRGKFRLLGLGLSDERYGIGVRKGRAGLRAKVNRALEQMERDGVWQRAAGRHFGPAGYRYEPPPPITETG